jgi:hypothetical protein
MGGPFARWLTLRLQGLKEGDKNTGRIRPPRFRSSYYDAKTRTSAAANQEKIHVGFARDRLISSQERKAKQMSGDEADICFGE